MALNPRRVLATALTLCVLAAGLPACTLVTQRPADSVGAAAGDIAPDFSLPDLNGQHVSLSEMRGKPVMVNFWASWCGPCKIEIPVIQAYYEDNQGKDLTILAVNAGEPEDAVRAFVDENKMTFRVLADSSGEAARMYRVRGIPASFFVDKDGRIAQAHLGPISRKQIEGYVQNLTAQ